LRLTGSVTGGALRFELEGSLLTDGPFAVPLFGAPARVRVDQATEGGKPAAIGFEVDRYFLFTAARRFLVRGTLTLDEDRVLSIPGPLNTFEADLADGRCVEGARLSGLSNATVHFDRAVTKEKAEPTVFQLSRAVRVGREISFEYRLVMKSGADLGVVRLPLAFGERVLDATGVSGFRIDGGDVVLPTSGHGADIRVTGTLPSVGTFKPDERSAYEWWLLESDAEHRITVTGDARQLDSTESPIARTLPTSRLYMVQRGQHIEVAVQTLVSLEVLAAVVRNHDRTVVLTRTGDLVADETLHYENNGIDYLFADPRGRPIYLATDGKSERIMHSAKDAEEVMVPLRTGGHSARMQSLSQAPIARFFGRTEVPLATYALTASRVSVRLGLPAFVHPLALLGGDRPYVFLDVWDVGSMILAAAAALLLMRSWRDRALVTIALGGLWFLSEPLFALALGVGVVGGLLWMLNRLVSRKVFLLAATFLVCTGGFLVLIMTVAVGMRRSETPMNAPMKAEEAVPASSPPAYPASAAEPAEAELGGAAKAKGDLRRGSFLAQNAAGGVVEGVTPVALTLPEFERSLYASRELVTRERPFEPVLLYTTSWALGPMVLVWLGCLAWLVRSHFDALKDLFGRIRARLTRPPVAAPPA
jgi:hypothetical protein